MNASFGSTDIYLTGPESTFCPLFFFFCEKISEHLKKVFLACKLSKIGRKFINTLERTQKVEKELFYEVIVTTV